MSTAFMPLLGTDTRPCWRLSAIQVCNWGSYDGLHAPIPIHEDATLFVGKSGSGKSTLLDAYMLLLNDNDASLNEASNSGNSSSRRTPITYTRGQTGTEPADPSSYDLRDKTLRGYDPESGQHSDTASGIAAVFAATDGQQMTILRLFHVPAHARVMNDCTVRFGYAMRDVDLREVMDFAESKFQQLKTHVPGWIAANGPGDIRSQAFRRFGVTASDPLPVLDLMKKVQSSKPQASVNDLYQTMLDREPDTYRQAALILKNHADLRAVRAQMVDAEKQITRLEPIESYHARMETARATLEAAESLGVQTNGPSLYAAWLANESLQMLDRLESGAQETAVLTHRRVMAAEQSARESEMVERRARDAYLDAGGNRTQLLERDYEEACRRLKAVKAARERWTGVFASINASLPTDFATLTRAQEQAQNFLAVYDTTSHDVDERAVNVSTEFGKTKATLQEAQEALRAMQTSKSNIPKRHLRSRDLYAQASSLGVERMPFIGQLIDVREGYEEWRTAINAVLGGWAQNLVIDPSDRHHLQRAIDKESTEIRLSRYVSRRTPYVDNDDPATLAGRIIVDEKSPFAGWIREEINKRANYECVETGEDLGDGSIARVTLSGQVAERRRDVHGGDTKNVIGFNIENQIAQARARLTELAAECSQAEENVRIAFAAKEDLVKARSAHKVIGDLSWSDLDLESAEHAEATSRAAVDAAHNPQSLVGQLKSAYEDAIRARSRALATEANLRAQALAADKIVAELIALKELEYQSHDPELLAGLSEEQNAFLQEHLSKTSGADLTFTDYEKALMQWGHAKEVLTRTLKQELHTAGETYAIAADSLRSVMASYDSDWPDKSAERLPDPEREYATYLAILTSLRHNDLPTARDQWEKKISDDATRGIGLLRRAYGDYTSTVRETLANLNQVLMGIPFRDGTKRIRLDVHDRTRANAALTDFLSELAGLTEQAAHLNPSGDIRAQRETLFIRLDTALAHIDPDSKERDLLLDVNRHLVFRATVVDADDPRIENDVIDALTGTQSGGESQQISAIIAGAALRYRMNDGGEAPRFMPIVLDEAFIKADADFTEQGINAWRRLGFQLIVGAPEEKTESLMRTIPAMRVVTKDNERHTSHIFSVDRASETVSAG